MSIIIVDNFQVNIKSPIDDRLIVGTNPILNMGETYSITYKTRDNILYKYPGLRIWDFNESIPYVWNGSTWLNENTSGALVETGGVGYANYLTKFKIDGTVLTKSLLFDNNSNVGLGIFTGISPNSVQQWLPSSTGDVLTNSVLSTSLINRGIHVNGNIRTNNFFSGDGQYIINLHANNIRTGTLNISRIAIPISPISGQAYVLTNTNGNTIWATSDTLKVTRDELGFINNGNTVSGEVSNNPDLNNPLVIASTVATKVLADRIVNVNNLLNTHTINISNPHSVNKTQVGLGNIPNQTSYSNGSSDDINNNDSQVLATTALTYKLNQKIDSIPTAPIVVSDTAYGSSWNGVTTIAPSKNAVYDKIETMIQYSLQGMVWQGLIPRYTCSTTSFDPGDTNSSAISVTVNTFDGNTLHLSMSVSNANSGSGYKQLTLNLSDISLLSKVNVSQIFVSGAAVSNTIAYRTTNGSVYFLFRDTWGGVQSTQIYFQIYDR